MAGATCAASAGKSHLPTFSSIFSFWAGSDAGGARCATFCRMRTRLPMTLAATVNGDAIRETFREWNAERDSLDAELSDSLAALEAYQLHLDAWQRNLRANAMNLQRPRAIRIATGLSTQNSTRRSHRCHDHRVTRRARKDHGTNDRASEPDRRTSATWTIAGPKSKPSWNWPGAENVIEGRTRTIKSRSIKNASQWAVGDRARCEVNWNNRWSLAAVECRCQRLHPVTQRTPRHPGPNRAASRIRCSARSSSSSASCVNNGRSSGKATTGNR